MRLLKQICSIALSAGMVLSPVASVMAAEGVTQTAAEETIESWDSVVLFFCKNTN